MVQRVEQLHRLGLLYDEGLYLVRPYATWEVEEAAEPVHSTVRWRVPARHEKKAAQHRRVLASTAYLLIAPKSVYDDAYHCITIDWEPP
ncbi:hypothetical protein NXY56_008032 [Leishmania guyanensis]